MRVSVRVCMYQACLAGPVEKRLQRLASAVFKKFFFIVFFAFFSQFLLVIFVRKKR